VRGVSGLRGTGRVGCVGSGCYGACGYASRRVARPPGRSSNLAEPSAVYNVVLQARTIANTTGEALDVRAAEGISLVGAVGQPYFQGNRPTRRDNGFFPIVEDLVLNIVVHPLVACYAHLVAAYLRVVVEGGTHALAYHSKVLSEHYIVDAIAGSRRTGTCARWRGTRTGGRYRGVGRPMGPGWEGRARRPACICCMRCPGRALRSVSRPRRMCCYRRVGWAWYARIFHSGCGVCSTARAVAQVELAAPLCVDLCCGRGHPGVEVRRGTIVSYVPGEAGHAHSFAVSIAPGNVN
jgi:hypothetical protein